MVEVRVICEGHTEVSFVKALLIPHFARQNIFLSPNLMGGDVTAKRLIPDIRNHLKTPHVYCTTFIDFYGSSADFPGKAEAAKQTTLKAKANCVQQALTAQVEKVITYSQLERFIPYVQMYEFEALLFSDPAKFCKGLDKSKHEKPLQTIRDEFHTPEEINDSPNTAPSKRIKKLIPDYDKSIDGTLGALEIGLSTIRKECVLFNEWIVTLEGLNR